MGLAGRKVKQRIGTDPRNLTWADNATKFGQAYLTKMGWDPSKGLGINADGRTSHVKVRQKLDFLGIGAEQGKGDVAWKQSRDYEALLMRLNAASGGQAEEDKGNEKEKEEEEGKNEERLEGVREEGEMSWKSKKRKRERERGGEGDREDDGDRSKKRRKENKEKIRTKEKGGKKNKEGEDEVLKPGTVDWPEGNKAATETSTQSVVVPRPMAHRARFLKAKKMLLESPSAIAEILGISGSMTPVSTQNPTSATASSLALAESTELTSNLAPILEHDLTIATKSVADYFKERLAAKAVSKAGLSLSLPAASASRSNDSVLNPRTVQSNSADEDRVRLGIGARSLLQAREDASPAQRDDDIPQVAGLGFKRCPEIVEVVGGAARAHEEGWSPNQEEQEEGSRKRTKDKSRSKKERKGEKGEKEKEEKEENVKRQAAETNGVETTSSKKGRKSKSEKRAKDSER